MNWCKLINGFIFNNYAILDDHIRTIASINLDTFVENRHCDFTFHI